jgi:pimeloyl-ACP methyl ester carboxylesterase
MLIERRLRCALSIIGLLGAFIGAGLQSPSAAQTVLAPPAFTEAPCDLSNVSRNDLARLRCGTVNVPRDYRHPSAGQFTLAVVVIRSERQPALAEPLLYISGGPGGPLTIYAGYQAAHPYAWGRDLILVDQRGMGRSEPRLCPDLRDAMVDAIAATATGPEAEMQAKRRAVFAACRRQAVAQGINLQDFGTPVTVEDFSRVRQALGVKRWNVFGVSYGTTVAMTLMARYPDTVRAAVLDSVNPPDPLLPPWSANVADAREAFFEACNRDKACAAMFPDLAGTYRETLVRLRQTPLSVRFPPGMHQPSNHGPLTASLFELVVGHLVYYANFYPGLPRIIASVHDGETALFEASLASLLGAARDRNTGSDFAANAAVDCRDRPRFHDRLAAGANVFERTSLYGICDVWSELGPSPVVPLNTTVPTLVLAGQFDPNARPAASRHFADLIGRQAQWVEFPLIGHSARAFSPCASRIVAEFVDHPAEVLDTSCADHPEPIFYLPRP